MSITCPKCGTINRPGAKTCALCGVELQELSFEELFGPPRELRDRYVVQRVLRQDVGTSLYKALDRQEGGRPCQIQEITTTLQDPLDRKELEERFLIEAAARQAVQHPHVARVTDAFVHRNRLYLITEAIEGTSLQEIVEDRRQNPSETTLLHWARQIADLLDHLHSQSPPILLGYLSPASIQIDPAGDVKLVDFGLSRFLQPRFGRGDLHRGVAGYEAPEQRQGQLTPQSDIYSLGIVLFAVATHHDPTERPLPMLSHRAPHLSDAASEAIARAYRRSPEKRYANAAEMREAIAALGEPLVLKVTLPPFTLAEGQEAITLHELVRLCTAHWDAGLRALVNNRIADWLETSAQRLRESGQNTEADEITAAARRTAQVRQEISQQATPAGMAEIAANAAYAAWLEEMGAVGVQPRLQVTPRGFDFGQIPPTKKAIAPIQIHNRGRGYLTGHVESPFPWLTIPQPRFGCRGGETVEINVVARGRQLPPGSFHTPQAIRVISNGGETWLEARVESAEPVLAVEPGRLDFGPISRSGAHITHLTISNQGGGLLSGQVTSRLPWLRVRRPGFRCPSGASARIPVELLGAEMPPEADDATRARRALVVDSDSGQAAVEIAWQWARPSLSLDATTLEFGAARRATRIARALKLSNPGTADLVGTIKSRAGWLTVQPAEFRCPPGETQTLTATCDTAEIPGGDTILSEALFIDANAGQQAISASVEVLAPELSVAPTALDLGTVQDGDDVEVNLTVGNRGSVTWEGTVRSRVPWLAVEPQSLLCEPGHFVPLTVTLNTSAFETGGEWTVPDALTIEGQGEACTVGAQVALARPQLTVARRSLDFGIIGRQEIAALPLEIANTGTGEMDWRIEWPKTGAEAWLEVSPPGGRCGPGETTTARITAYALAVEGNAGQSWLTVHSNAGRADLPVSVALSAPRLVVEPLVLDFGTSENYAPVSRTLRISNRGVGDLAGQIEVQVPWLACAPQTFACETGASALIKVQARPDGLREGLYQPSDALKIESSGGSETIDVQITVVLVPRLHLSDLSLRFAPDGPQTLQLQMENQGHGNLRLTVLTGADWIQVNRQEWTVKGGRKARLKVTVARDDAPPGATGIIEIHAPERVARVEVQLE